MPVPITVRIVVLRVEDDVWCDCCGLPAASLVTYVLELAAGAIPDGLRGLTYCETCEPSR